MKRFVFLIAVAVSAFVLFSGCVSDGQTPDGDGGVDLCSGVSCPDGCYGTDYKSEGACQDGQCVYANVEEKAGACGWNEFGLDLDTIQRECRYDQYHNDYRFFFTIKNLGTKATSEDASIWLVAEGVTEDNYTFLNKAYGQGRILWEEVNWPTSPWHGQEWSIRDKNEFQAFDYQLIYCEIENVFIEECTENIGLVLYEGNSTDCNITNVEG